MLRYINFLKICIIALILSVVTLNPLWADDTEIFFSEPPEYNPNLLFVLDGSISMARFDCLSGNRIVSSRTPCDNNGLNGTTSRLDRMVDALTEVLQQLTDVNVGFMRFSHNGSGGRITYPILPIDQQVCEDESCNSDSTFETISQVQDPTDDVYEDDSGFIEISDIANPLMTFDGDQQAVITGLRFPDLRVPQGATIEEAVIEFKSASNADLATNLSLVIEDTEDSAPFESDNRAISDRSWLNNSVTWNDVPPWAVDETIQSPDLAPLLSRVVNKTDWCGGNAASFSIRGTGNRLISAFERGSQLGPILKVKYSLQNIPATGGCNIAPIVIASIESNDNDVRETTSSGDISVGTSHQRVNTSYSSGFSFTDINVPQGAIITDARLELTTVDNNWTDDRKLVINITLEDSANPDAFTTARFDLRDRSKTTGILWDSPPDKNTTTSTEDLSDLLTKVIGEPEWTPGNRVNIFLERESGDGQRSFVSNDRDSGKSARLFINYTTGVSAGDEIAGPVVDVRSKLLEQLTEFRANGSTPTVGALLEARHYFAGAPVQYGIQRGAPGNSNLRSSRVSHPDSYSGGELIIPNGCGIDPNSRACADEFISGSPEYISPIEHECQPNHVIVLTDGIPSSSSLAETRALTLINGVTDSCVNTRQDSDGGYRGKCGIEVADYLNGRNENDPDDGTIYEDLRNDFAGDQTITVHTIGFNFNDPWLGALAEAGGGEYFTANSSTELVTAVNNIAKKVKETNTTFVAPGATIDSFSRIAHRQDIYLALFQPNTRSSWKGNLKKYELKGNPPEIHDANNNEAINKDTGQFKLTTQSFWSEEADGNEVTQGGAASRLTPLRTLTTYFDGIDADSALTAEINKISSDNRKVTDILDFDTDEEIEQVIRWLYGEDVNNEEINTDYRHHIGDPLHSTPVLITYGGTQAEPESVSYFGTNEGFIHGIDTTTGEELFAFMPNELIPNLNKLFKNEPVGPGELRPYGMDGDISLQIVDKDNNGLIEDDDKAILYIGMRRGGRSYYALDVSDKHNPKFKWQIEGGVGPFVELAETWSKPILTNIRVEDKIKKVLIFSGGYDNSHDEKDRRLPDTHDESQPDTKGRAIYIVEADDPSNIIWAGSINPQGATEVFPDMTYSIPSDIAVVSEGASNLATQFYVGDMGGRIWRFDINNGSKGTDLVDGGIIADLASDHEPVNNRRFYHAPDLSLSNINNERFINIAVGSGYQAHPLNTVVRDSFFLLRYPFQATGNYGTTGNPATEDIDPATATYRPITMDDLHDATDNIIGEGNVEEQNDAREELREKSGWFITMEDIDGLENTGEKILGTSNTLNGVVRFTSYLPASDRITCQPAIGSSRFWAVNLDDATPDGKSIAKGINNPTRADRNKAIPGGGIAPPVKALLVSSDSDVTPTVVSGANVLWQGDDLDRVRRWFWSESPE